MQIETYLRGSEKIIRGRRDYLRKAKKYVSDLNIIERAGRSTLEYFLGTETRNFYRNERTIANEIFEDENNLRTALKGLNQLEFADIIIGKYAPNLIDIGAITYSIITENPTVLSLVICSEFLRMICNSSSKNGKNSLEISRKRLIENLQFNQTLKDLL